MKSDYYYGFPDKPATIVGGAAKVRGGRVRPYVCPTCYKAFRGPGIKKHKEQGCSHEKGKP